MMHIGYNFLSKSADPMKNAIKFLCDNDLADEHLIFRYNRKRGRKIEALPCHDQSLGTVEFDLRSWIYEELFLPFAIANNNIDIFYCPGLNIPLRQPCKTAVAITDLNRIMFPDEKVKGLETKLSFDLQLAAAKKANRIITFSQYSKKVIYKKLGIHKAKIEVVPYPVDKDYAPIYSDAKTKQTASRYGIERPYFIYSGGAAKRNNVKELVDIFYGFINLRNDCLLVIEGEIGKNAKDEIKRMDADNRIVFTGKIPDEDKSLLFNGAIAFITASLHETACEQELKAMACGIPVIAYNNSAISELFGHCAVLVPCHDKNTFVKAMKDAKDHPNMRLQLRALSIQQSKYFSLENHAKVLLGIFKNIHNESYHPDEK